MKCKIRTLFISIALSILVGCLTCSNAFTSEAAETHFGLLAETFDLNNELNEKEITFVSEYRITSEINEGDALRHFPPTKRVNNFPTSKMGLASIKRNYILYSSPQKFESYRRFPPGLTEAKHYLISLGKLTI